ncbi:MAG: SDR family NAD(P)-dependent oxidoreductase, partial [Pseudomonadales bacterium]|nr:SDR family NAD(P)-dependent oxidoreductase [Pseudomonadales bacterium]
MAVCSSGRRRILPSLPPRLARCAGIQQHRRFRICRDPAMTRYDYAGRTALITGAAGGIGSATALAFAAAGAKVVLADIADSGAQLAQSIVDQGGKAWFVRTDVTRIEQIEALVAQTLSYGGSLDFAFNNAGIEEENARLGDSDE